MSGEKDPSSAPPAPSQPQASRSARSATDASAGSCTDWAGDANRPPDGAVQSAPDQVRAGFCAILGLPNAGKSTLLNRVLGVRLVAVSRKPQTTRNRILGVHNITLPGPAEESDSAGDDTGWAHDTQIIFVDTPGIQTGPGALRRYMRDQSLGAVGDADVALLLVDMHDPAQHSPDRFRTRDTAALYQALAAGNAPVVVALNKIDLVKRKDEMLPVIRAYGELDLAAEIVPISAATGSGIDDLVAAIGRRLPVGPRLFPEDMITDRAERFLAGELIREQLFHQLGQELPYAAAVVVESFHERARQGDVTIGAVIYVERESQKGIVVGTGGRRIKAVGQRARAAIGQLLGCPVHVKLHVKVASNWSRIDRGIRQMGYR